MVGVWLAFVASSLLPRTFLEDRLEMPWLKCLKAKVFPGFTRVPCKTLGPHPPIPFLNFYTHAHTFSLSIILKAVSIHPKLLCQPHLWVPPSNQEIALFSWTPLEMLSSSSHLSICTSPTLEDTDQMQPPLLPPPPGSFPGPLRPPENTSPHPLLFPPVTWKLVMNYFVTCLLWLSWTVTKIFSFKKQNKTCVLFSQEYCEGFGRRGWALTILSTTWHRAWGTQ